MYIQTILLVKDWMEKDSICIFIQKHIFAYTDVRHHYLTIMFTSYWCKFVWTIVKHLNLSTYALWEYTDMTQK